MFILFSMAMEKILKSNRNERLDVFLSENLDGISRMQAQRLIKAGKVSVNEICVKKPSFKINSGDTVRVEEIEAKPLDIRKEDKPLKIVYEDDYLLIVDKEAGVTVHPVGAKKENTLVNRLLFHVKDLSGIGGVIRPGIVHRLDKDTSGLLVVAKNDEAHLKLSSMLKTHEIDRRYIALVKGIMKIRRGKIDLPIARKKGETKMYVAPFGRRAITHFHVIEEIGKRFSLVAVKLETGRTHQIRVHFSYSGHPIVGDYLYGGRIKEIPLRRQFLHAYEISFIHPIMGQRITAYSMLPKDLKEVLDLIREKWKTK